MGSPLGPRLGHGRRRSARARRLAGRDASRGHGQRDPAWHSADKQLRGGVPRDSSARLYEPRAHFLTRTWQREPVGELRYKSHRATSVPRPKPSSGGLLLGGLGLDERGLAFRACGGRTSTRNGLPAGRKSRSARPCGRIGVAIPHHLGRRRRNRGRGGIRSAPLEPATRRALAIDPLYGVELATAPLRIADQKFKLSTWSLTKGLFMVVVVPSALSSAFD